MNNVLLISNIILWISVIGLAFIVFALARQIGVLYERVAPAGALMVNQNLKVGMEAPKLELEDINSQDLISTGVGNTKAQLLFFVSPSCPVCKTLLPILKSSRKSEKQWLDVVLASDGPKAEHGPFIKEYDLSSFPYVLSERLGKQYGVAKLPYAILIDEAGEIASMGIINSREHLESLFESKERGIDSIQSYMAGESEISELATEIKAS